MEWIPRPYLQIYSEIRHYILLMYLMGTDELLFRDRQFNRDLVCDIMHGLRPLMPDSAPEEYKKLARRCCDVDPDTRPDAQTLYHSYYQGVERG